MHLGLLIISALPATWAAHAYAVPQSLSLLESSAAEDSGCTLPDTYHIRGFKAESKDSGKTLSGFDYDFFDEDTKLTTTCHKNASSKPIVGWGTDRFACDNSDVEFIWNDETKKLWVMESICSKKDGTPAYEVSGSVMIPFKCARTGSCSSNSTDHRATFTSLQPPRQAPPS